MNQCHRGPFVTEMEFAPQKQPSRSHAPATKPQLSGWLEGFVRNEKPRNMLKAQICLHGGSFACTIGKGEADADASLAFIPHHGHGKART